jgi:hypothetical protein
MGQILQHVFLYPGNKARDACHVRAEDDRTLTRTLVNMLVWNFVVLVAVVALY